MNTALNKTRTLQVLLAFATLSVVIVAQDPTGYCTPNLGSLPTSSDATNKAFPYSVPSSITVYELSTVVGALFTPASLTGW